MQGTTWSWGPQYPNDLCGLFAGLGHVRNALSLILDPDIPSFHFLKDRQVALAQQEVSLEDLIHFVSHGGESMENKLEHCSGKCAWEMLRVWSSSGLVQVLQ